MIEKTKLINQAIDSQKKYYRNECIFSGHFEEVLIGAHVFKRSTHPEFAHLQKNIYPLSPENDANLERVTNPWKRICVIIRYVHAEHRGNVMIDLGDLIAYVLEYELDKKGGLS